ncbi:MAG: DNA recombination protein RmuC, partial [Pseudomonas sp.]|nr:DNA recombination protein RmuC [Pseudomonas sp.]
MTVDLTSILLGLVAGAVPCLGWVMQVQRGQGARKAEQALLEERLNAAQLTQAGLLAQLEASRDEISDLSEANTIKQTQLAAQGRELELLQIDRDNARDAAHAWHLERANREAELRRLEAQAARLEAELREQQESHQQRLEDLQEARDTLRAQFADLATKIFDEREQRFAQTSQQNLGQLLDPLKERIQVFENHGVKVIIDPKS